MKNPYFIDEPAVISFSGGRTSAYMLYRVLEAHGGTLPDDVKVIFANTGKEVEATLAFVYDCAQNWNIDITWLEYTGKKQFKVTGYNDASRHGEPFDQLTTDKKYLPNMIARFCTSELKVLPIDRYMKQIGFDEYLTLVGIRADEPRRAAKMRAKENYAVPLVDDSVNETVVSDFWKANSFDLALPNAEVNLLSNCDLCFLKGRKIKQSIIQESPISADWWIAQEKKIGGLFRSDQPNYKQMQIIATDQGQLFDFSNDESISCFCGD